jgi:hypothetical protein
MQQKTSIGKNGARCRYLQKFSVLVPEFVSNYIENDVRWRSILIRRCQNYTLRVNPIKESDHQDEPPNNHDT